MLCNMILPDKYIGGTQQYVCALKIIPAMRVCVCVLSGKMMLKNIKQSAEHLEFLVGKTHMFPLVESFFFFFRQVERVDQSYDVDKR